MLIDAHVTKWHVANRLEFLAQLQSAGVYTPGDLDQIEFRRSIAESRREGGTCDREGGAPPRPPNGLSGPSLYERYSQRYAGARALAPMMCPRNYKTVEAKKAHEGDLKEFDRLQKLAMNGETLTTQQDERKDLLFERIRAFNRSQKESDMPKTSKVQRATCARAVQVLQEDRCGLFVLGDVQTATVEERGQGTLKEFFQTILELHHASPPSNASELQPLRR